MTLLPAPEPWPPATYYTTGTYPTVLQPTVRVCVPLEQRVRVAQDGSRHLSFQLPLLPIDADKPISISGNLTPDPTTGELRNVAGLVVGQLDFATGRFDVDVDKSPSLGTRLVSYFSKSRLVEDFPREFGPFVA